MKGESVYREEMQETNKKTRGRDRKKRPAGEEILILLSGGAEMTVTQMVEAIGKSRKAVRDAADGLCEKGLVVKRIREGDAHRKGFYRLSTTKRDAGWQPTAAMRAELEGRLLSMLTRPMTRSQLIANGIDRQLARSLIASLKEKRLIHVHTYERVRGGGLSPAYLAGDGEDMSPEEFPAHEQKEIAEAKQAVVDYVEEHPNTPLFTVLKALKDVPRVTVAVINGLILKGEISAVTEDNHKKLIVSRHSEDVAASRIWDAAVHRVVQLGRA